MRLRIRPVRRVFEDLLGADVHARGELGHFQENTFATTASMLESELDGKRGVGAGNGVHRSAGFGPIIGEAGHPGKTRSLFDGSGVRDAVGPGTGEAVAGCSQDDEIRFECFE